MRIHKLFIVLGLMIAFGLFFELAAYADEANESTRITFSHAVQVPGQVLPAGTYVFQQADPNNDPNLIAIYSADHTVLYEIAHTVPAERTAATGDTTITMAEPETGKPDVVVKWFYPGRLIGHEFLYSTGKEQQLARATQETFVGSQPVPSGLMGGN